jgi:NADH-quinone oxidoreductase subunit G
MNAATLEKLNLAAGEFARFRQGEGDDAGAMLTVEVDERVPSGCIRLPAALPVTAGLGAMTGSVTAERVS